MVEDRARYIWDRNIVDVPEPVVATITTQLGMLTKYLN